MSPWAAFFISLFLGVLIGVFTMGLIALRGEADKQDEQFEAALYRAAMEHHKEGRLLATQREVKRLGKKAAAGLPAKITKCLPAPVDPNWLKVHRRDLFHLKHCLASDPRSVFLVRQHLETLQRGERLNPTMEEYPEPHDSLLTQETYRYRVVWRLLQALGDTVEVQKARQEVEYTALFVSRLQDLFDSINKNLLSYCGQIRGLPMYLR